MSTPRVSIVVPLHEGAGTVIETLEAVRAQTVGDWELIVVDDASTDGGPELVRRWAAAVEQPVQVLGTESAAASGPSATRNRGLAVAVAPLVTFLDADDLWAPTFLHARLAVSTADPSVALVWGPARYWYPDDHGLDFDQPTGLTAVSRTFAPAAPIPVWINDLRHTPCPSAAVFARSALLDAEGFPEALRRGEDIAACLLVAADHPTAFDPTPLVRYRRHAGSSTTRSGRGGRSTEDLAFGTWLVAWIRTRPDLRALRRLAGRCYHGLAHRAVEGLPPVTGRWQLTRAILAPRGARGRWWALALDWVLPLRWSRRVAARLEGAVGHDGGGPQGEEERHQGETGGGV